MQIGFNNDVEYAEQRYHIQTEDHGLDAGRITSHIFRGGQILDTISVSYTKAVEELSEPEARDEEIRKRMRALHKLCYRNITSGKYDAKEASDARKPERPETPEASPDPLSESGQRHASMHKHEDDFEPTAASYSFAGLEEPHAPEVAPDASAMHATPPPSASSLGDSDLLVDRAHGARGNRSGAEIPGGRPGSSRLADANNDSASHRAVGMAGAPPAGRTPFHQDATGKSVVPPRTAPSRADAGILRRPASASAVRTSQVRAFRGLDGTDDPDLAQALATFFERSPGP